jgi:5-methylthioribose kinase
VSATSSAELLDSTTVLAYLRERGLVGAESGFRARELAGGVSSVVLEVEGPALRLIVKQSLPRLRVAEEWLAKRDRILAEARGLELAALLTPGRVPRLLDVDDVGYAIAIEAPRASGAPGRSSSSTARRGPGDGA